MVFFDHLSKAVLTLQTRRSYSVLMNDQAYQFENLYQKPAIRLRDGVPVRLALRTHPKPIFMCDAIKHGQAFNIAGYIYDRLGCPVDPRSPAIVEIIEYE